MGVIKRGLLGGFSGRVGNIVGSSWKGIAIIKSLPLSVANPRTTGQTTQRTKFSTVVDLASNILSQFIKPLWDRFASQMSGYNAFTSVNVKLIDPTNSNPIVGLVASQGKIPALRGLTFTPNLVAGTVLVEWDTDLQGSYERADDIILGFAKSESDQLFAFMPSGVVRSDGSATMTFPDTLRDPNTMAGAVVAVSADGFHAGADLCKQIG